MANCDLPKHIDVLKRAEQRVALAGKASLASMSRLVSLVTMQEGDAAIDWQFGKDEEGRIFIKGSLTADLTVVCQRCLEPMIYSIVDTVSLSPVANDTQADTLPDHYEPILIEQDSVQLLSLIEDELILRLPMVPMHDLASCRITEKFDVEIISDEETNSANKAFAALAKLKL